MDSDGRCNSTCCVVVKCKRKKSFVFPGIIQMENETLCTVISLDVLLGEAHRMKYQKKILLTLINDMSSTSPSSYGILRSFTSKERHNLLKCLKNRTGATWVWSELTVASRWEPNFHWPIVLWLRNEIELHEYHARTFCSTIIRHGEEVPRRLNGNYKR